MTRIGLLSDTHSYLDTQLLSILSQCDEIWHAGDFGSVAVYEELYNLKKTFRAVYGNVDGNEIRLMVKEELFWQVEGKTILMTHIGGYPGKYPARIKKLLINTKPSIFVCGHSHILKIIYDKELNLLHLNPGAAGKEGFHKVRTALRFTIDGDTVKDMEVIEFSGK